MNVIIIHMYIYIYIYMFKELSGASPPLGRSHPSKRRVSFGRALYIYIYIHNNNDNNYDNNTLCAGREADLRPFSFLRFRRLQSRVWSGQILRWSPEVLYTILGGGRVLPTQILLPRIARLASNCSTGSYLSNLNKRISSKSSNWESWARKARIDKVELDEGFQPYHPPFRFFR